MPTMFFVIFFVPKGPKTVLIQGCTHCLCNGDIVLHGPTGVSVNAQQIFLVVSSTKDVEPVTYDSRARVAKAAITKRPDSLR